MAKKKATKTKRAGLEALVKNKMTKKKATKIISQSDVTTEELPLTDLIPALNNASAWWHELTERKDEFQSIVRLLVEFDEKTGRFKRFPDPETHYSRKAISVAGPKKLRIFLQHLGGFVYYVVAEIDATNGHLCTSWVHEDGIRLERDDLSRRKKYPAHNIVCLTDLYEDACRPLPLDPEDAGVINMATLGLLADVDAMRKGV